MRVYRTQTAGSEPSVHAHYLYDGGGQRVKKLVRKQGGQFEVTVYIDGIFEHRRVVRGGTLTENNILHVTDSRARVAVVRVGAAFDKDVSPALTYQLGDHLGNSTLVLDGAARLVNREEYTPFGESAFGSFARKRYRFSGKERDEESGLNYHGARYYLPWLGRWASCDPLRYRDGLNLYAYVHNNPVNAVDGSGLQTETGTATPRENAARMSSEELHTQAGPETSPTDDQPYTPNFKLVGSHVSGALVGEGNLPKEDLSQAYQAPKEQPADTLELAPCFSDAPRGIGMPVASCEGPRIVAKVLLGARFPAQMAKLEALAEIAQAKGDNDPHLTAGAMAFVLTLPPAERAVPGSAAFMRGDDRFLQYAANRSDVDPHGTFDVIAHGAPNKMQIQTATGPVWVNHRVAARLIQESPGYTGQGIRLLSCNTGACNTGFAQNLSNTLNVTVSAPTDYLWSYSTGRMVVAAPLNAKDLSLGPDLAKLGTFKSFTPRN